MSIDRILQEASTALIAAKKYESQLKEAGMTPEDFLRVRALIARVAAHHYPTAGASIKMTSELYELQAAKEVLLSAALQKFGAESNVWKEFSQPRSERPCHT
jgi:hypothetical protein